MTQLRWLIPLLALAACKKGDDCQTFWDKTAPTMSKMAGAKLPPDAKDKFFKECRSGDKMKSDPVFKCVLGASGDAAVEACMTKSFDDYQSKSKKTEALMLLNKLGKNLKVLYATEAAFPAGKVGPLPAEPCCKGEGGKCAVVPADKWAADPVWSKLDFQIDDPARFQYSYESDGKTASATAVGDLDCDGKMITYKLEMSVDASGAAQMKVVEPAPDAD